MDNFSLRFLKRWREYRTKKFSFVGKFFVVRGINATVITAVSLLSGLTAIYFLFSSYRWFLVFAILHLFCDGLDGIVARAANPTKFGNYLDILTDNLVAILTTIKVGWFLQDYYVYIIAALYSLAFAVHLLLKLQTDFLGIRTAGLIVLSIAANPFFPYTNILLNLGYLAAGVAAAYSLAKEMQFLMRKS